MIKLGDNNIVGVYFGTLPITSIYNGVDKVFGKEPVQDGYIEFTANSTSDLYKFVLPIYFLGGDAMSNMLSTNDVPDNEKYIQGTVDWGDGVVENVTINNFQVATHQYGTNNTYTIRFIPTNSPNVPIIYFPQEPSSNNMCKNLTHIKSTTPVCIWFDQSYISVTNLTIESGTPIVFGEYNGKQYGCSIRIGNILTAESLLSNRLGDSSKTTKLKIKNIELKSLQLKGNFLKGCTQTDVHVVSDNIETLDYQDCPVVNPSFPLVTIPDSVNIYLRDKITDIGSVFTTTHTRNKFLPVIMDLGQSIPEQGYIDLTNLYEWGYNSSDFTSSITPTINNARDLKAEGLSMKVWIDRNGLYEWTSYQKEAWTDKGYTLVSK